MSKKFKSSYKTISEVVEILNDNNPQQKVNNPQTIRYWETQFKQLNPKKINSRRYYNQNNIDILLHILCIMNLFYLIYVIQYLINI